jgi:hypothetical protein
MADFVRFRARFNVETSFQDESGPNRRTEVESCSRSPGDNASARGFPKGFLSHARLSMPAVDPQQRQSVLSLVAHIEVIDRVIARLAGS